MTASRVLFFSQGVSLAHVARPAALAAGLAGAYDVHFARTRRMAPFVDLPGVRQHEVQETLTNEHFVTRLARGQPLFDEASLLADVREDLRLLKEVNPDLVVGDLRLSLQVSARLAGVRYALISNAHWSPTLPPSSYPLPDHPLASIFGRRLTEAAFHKMVGWVFRQHARPFNAVRRRHGLPELEELRHAYCDADDLLLADDARLSPAVSGATFLAPVVWEPPLPAPSWLETLSPDDNVVLVTVGSTGSQRLLGESLIDALRSVSMRAMVATADRGQAPRGVLTAPYIPGFEAAKRSRLVVCNGGNLSTAQALAAGRPFLGICSNMDQFLSCQPLVAAGAGLMVAASEATAGRLRGLLQTLIEDPCYADAARALQPRFAPTLAPERFRLWLEQTEKRSLVA